MPPKTFNITVTPATLIGVSVTDQYGGTAVAGTTDQLNVVGIFSDGSSQDLTNVATYTTSDPNTATVNSTGLLTGVATGQVQVAVSYDDELQFFNVYVSPALLTGLSVTDVNAGQIALGTTDQLTALGLYGDGTHQDLTQQVGWSSSDSSTAIV